MFLCIYFVIFSQVNITTLQVRVVTSDVVGHDPQTPDLVNLSSGPMAYEAAAIAAAVRNSLLVDAVDVRSCLRFILDQFNGWLERDQFPLVNVYDTIRSVRNPQRILDSFLVLVCLSIGGRFVGRLRGEVAF